MAIIESLLTNDFYTFTVGQTVLHHHPSAWVKYKFKCRNGNALPFDMGDRKNNDYINRIEREIDALCAIRLGQNELDYLKSIQYFKPDYIEYLRILQLNRQYIKVGIEGNSLSIIVEGPWISTIWFEVPLLLIVSTVFNELRTDRKLMTFTIEQEGKHRLEEKVYWLKSNLEKYYNNYAGTNMPKFVFADFGTRRAWSPRWHERVLSFLVANCRTNKLSDPMLVGTSNVFLAYKYKVKAIGTMSHQYLQAFQQLGPRLVDSQKVALQTWADEYRGELGIALSDVVGFDVFLLDFDRYFSLLFDGCRHDSGDPYVWCNKLISHYKNMRIDPKTKSAVFSDGLDFVSALHLFTEFSDKINTSFGIGTNLTNDLGLTPLQIVIKMVECNGRPVAKVSDSRGKGMCEDKEFLSYLEKVYRIGK